VLWLPIKGFHDTGVSSLSGPEHPRTKFSFSILPVKATLGIFNVSSVLNIRTNNATHATIVATAEPECMSQYFFETIQKIKVASSPIAPIAKLHLLEYTT
jgi:hypothetical protein